MRRLALGLPLILFLTSVASAQDNAATPTPADPPAKAGKGSSRAKPKGERAGVSKPSTAPGENATGAASSISPDPLSQPASPAGSPATASALGTDPATSPSPKGRGTRGQTTGTATGDPVPAASASEAAAKKAQQAAEARNKAWDVKMQKLMTGICRGC